MKKLSTIIVVLLSITSIASAQLLPSAALTTAEDFISVLDQQDYATAYQTSSKLLKLKIPQKTWINEQATAFQLLGQAEKRQLMSVKAREVYPSFPDGNYLIIAYETKTTYKAKAVEVLLLKEEHHTWQVCRYSIR